MFSSNKRGRYIIATLYYARTVITLEISPSYCKLFLCSLNKTLLLVFTTHRSLFSTFILLLFAPLFRFPFIELFSSVANKTSCSIWTFRIANVFTKTNGFRVELFLMIKQSLLLNSIVFTNTSGTEYPVKIYKLNIE